MKKYFFTLLFTLMVVTLTSCTNDSDDHMFGFPNSYTSEPAQYTTHNIPEVGDIVSFGAYKWQVLEVYDDGTALIISQNIIDNRSFHNTWEAVTWEESDLRLYLNTDFLHTFSQDEQARILPREVHTPDNEWYAVRGGNDTIDYIFLLSIDEVVQYFGGSGEASSPTPATYSIREWLINDEYNSARVAVDKKNVADRWWLRSPGFDYDFIAIVLEDGTIVVYGGGVAHTISGIRPALLLNFAG